MTYYVVIEQTGETARLECATQEEAHLVKVSFENYGKCQNISIETGAYDDASSRLTRNPFGCTM